MVDKFYLFNRLLRFVDDDFNIVDAKMNNYAGDIEIVGKDGEGRTLTFTVKIEEVQKDA